MKSIEEIPVPLSLYSTSTHTYVLRFPESRICLCSTTLSVSFVLSALDFSSLISHQDILALPHFLSSHSCIKNLANKSLLVLYYFFNTSWQILFHCGFLEIILAFKMLRLSGLKV